MLRQRIRNVLSVRVGLLMRLALVASVIGAILLIYVSNHLLTLRFTESQRNETQLRAALYAGNAHSLLQQQAQVPLLLVRDPFFITALQSKDFTSTSQRLIDFAAEIEAARILLLDLEGRAVAASDRTLLGMKFNAEPYFSGALRDPGTVFVVTGEDDAATPYGFHYARKVVSGVDPLGVIVVTVNLRELEEIWRRRSDQVAIATSDDQILLASVPAWRRLDLASLSDSGPDSGFGQMLPFLGPDPTTYAYIGGKRHLRVDSKIGFRGWRLYYFATLDNVRTRVNAILALEIMVLALLLALASFLVSKRLQAKSRQMALESAQLRALNRRLTREIEERRRVEKTLEDTEQSLEQASKLAALGQMSAAVSHELNQPLAAMRTYLAGARLLLRRRRADEALSSFHRIDDLIERMGAITRQLKSYARKGSEDISVVDLRDSLNGSLAMMAPQLGNTKVELRKSVPTDPVPVYADPVRLEQIIVNLLRNALDAVATEPDPLVDILLAVGSEVTLSVRDNGHGIEDPKQLFEPFYTTKKPGDGVGLGLAISAGIAKELGGRIVARNAVPKGAVFELVLPHADTGAERAAE